MSDGFPVEEFRRSLSLLATEWWVLVGGLAGYLFYGAWVVLTGLAVGRLVPGFVDAAVLTVGGVPVTGLSVVAVVAWLLVPATVAAWLTNGRFRNRHGNLAKRYRLNHPSVLVAPPGIVLLGCLLVSLAIGSTPIAIAVALVASVHLLVRTVVYGYRVYSLSVPPLFTLFLFATGAALAAGWLVQATFLGSVSPSVGNLVSAAGVDGVVETVLELTGVGPGTALTAVVATPALLSTTYLLAQQIAGAVVRSKAPLAEPSRRPGQRFPIMPPVAQAEGGRSGARAGSTSDRATGDETLSDADGERGENAAESETAETTVGDEGDRSSNTRVFTPDQSVPEEMETNVGSGVTTFDDADGSSDTEGEDDGWLDDTAVFSPERRDASTSEACPACGREIPPETTATFCPDCGERLD
ncbi:zinc ribbon domain-containing protein [Haloarcula nitratireducens]|uniref:Zinc ribbon domain-containing protein n=1 Tax=Haloarcula nitratireducens TaxID=2487749 RepID=A0AAW4PAP3_9EURY|nr:zinc ribbon domain-containing protein [Halomicroarcula nitratireducens]MBX0294545.1 zinc ribbon domain-containing protein [Halomicroarcula nitratireducens]